LEGDAKPGEACQRSEECAGDAYCSISGACPGVCAARKAEGEPCDRDNDCAYAGGAVFCDHSQATPVCHTLAPRAKAAEGEPCTRNLEGADSLTLCQDDLWCAELPGGDPRTDVLGRCSLPIAENAACLDSDDVCSDGMCKEDTKLCQRVVVLQKAGAACDKAAFAICDPTLGLRCSSGGVCIAAGSGSEGSTCFTGDLQRACDPGLYCAKAPQASADETGTCRALLATAEVCAGSNDCASASCVDGVCDARPCLR
jgi:hypothetical protein